MRSSAPTWLFPLAMGALCAGLGLLLGGLIADRATDWHGVSSFEGGSGLLVVLVALLGAAAGFVLGLVASLVLVRAAPATTLPVRIALPPLLVAALALAGGGLSRWLADVPPTQDGEALLLAIEVAVPTELAERWAQATPAPHLQIAALSGGHIATERPGPLWLADARSEGELRIVPGAVVLFTERKRLLRVEAGEASPRAGVAIPLRTHPTAEDAAWSDWLPRLARSADDPLDGLRLRYRVLRASEAVRSERVGAFEIDTLASDFHWRSERAQPGYVGAEAHFILRLGSQTLDPARLLQAAGIEPAAERAAPPRIHALATLAARDDALVLQVGAQPYYGHCLLLTAGTGLPRVASLGPCTGGDLGEALDGLAQPAPLRGFLDRSRFARPGLYRFEQRVLDSRSLGVTPLVDAPRPALLGGVAAVASAPDGSRYVRIATSADGPRAVEFSLSDGAYRWLPETPAPEAGWTHADRAWFDTHFDWRVDEEGQLHAVRRAAVGPG